MESRPLQAPNLQQQEKSLFLFVVVVGYIITFTVAVNGGEQFTVARLVIGIGCGAVYLVLGFFENEVLQRFSPMVRNAVFFALQISLVFGIGWVLGPGGNWLIGLPLAGLAVEKLSPRARWPVYIGLLAAIVLPILRYSTWQPALMNTFIISTAIFFVALITQIQLNERQARQRAEQLAIQLDAANHRLSEYASKVEELAAMQERNRLAREIHDSLGHYLTIVNVQLEAAKVTFGSDPERAFDSLEKASELVKRGLGGVRESVAALRVSPLENYSLPEAIATLLKEMEVLGIATELRVLGTPRLVDEKASLALYRIAQECLTNVRKHARASSVNIELDFHDPCNVRLHVRDNGVGAVDPSSGGFGLVAIQERILLLDGEYHIETQPGKGFCVEVIVPILGEGIA